MHYKLEQQAILAGFSGGHARPGEKVPIVTQEFLSSEDGETLISRLRGISEAILSKSPNRIKESEVDHMVIIMDRNGNLDV